MMTAKKAIHKFLQLVRLAETLTFCSVLFVQSSAQALGEWPPLVPSGSLQSARRKHLLLATVEATPKDFEWHEKRMTIREAWIQRIEHGNEIELCFTLRGFKKRLPYIGMDHDDLVFGKTDQPDQKYYGKARGFGTVFPYGADGHCVHDLRLTAEERENLPTTMYVVFCGSDKEYDNTLSKTQVLKQFVFEINRVTSKQKLKKEKQSL